MTASTPRPDLVTAAAVLLFVQAAYSTLLGLVVLAALAILSVLATGFGTWTATGAALALVLLLYVVAVPVASFVFGRGLLARRGWAWTGALVFCGVQLITIPLGVLLLSQNPSTGQTSVDQYTGGIVIAGAIPAATAALLMMKPSRHWLSAP